jgi:hypothetical protein
MRVGIISWRVGLAMLMLVVGLLAVSTTIYAASAKPGITMQVSPASQSVERGKTASYTVTVTSAGGFAGSVALKVTGLPTGATALFQPASVPLTSSGSGATATSLLSVTTSSSTPVGAFSLTITGTSGKTTGSVSAGLTVNYPVSASLSMTATPSSVTMAPGSIAAYSVALTRTGVSGNVGFSLLGGLPSGATWSFSPNPTTGGSSTLQVSTAPTSADGSYTLYLTASGQDSTGTTRYAYASVQLVLSSPVRSFTISGDLTGQLTPGLTLPLQLRVTNPNQKALSVTNLSASLTGVTRTADAVARGLACSTGDYALMQYTGPYPLTIPAGGTLSLSQLGVPPAQWPKVSLLNRPVNQDGCKGATVTMTYAGSGQGN